MDTGAGDGDSGDRDVVIGVIGKPFGLDGDVYVHLDPDLDLALDAGDCLRTPDGPDLVVSKAVEHSGRTLLGFEGYGDRSAAERLRGIQLLVARSDIEIGEDAYWNDELLGRDVIDPDGGLLGVVEGIRDGVAHDYLVIARPDGGELEVPAVDEFLSITEDSIVVRLLPGMLE